MFTLRNDKIASDVKRGAGAVVGAGSCLQHTERIFLSLFFSLGDVTHCPSFPFTMTQN